MSYYSTSRNAQASVNPPDIVVLAVGLAVSNEAGAGLVEELVALGTAEAGGVPLQVRRDPQDVLVMDSATAAGAVRRLLT